MSSSTLTIVLFSVIFALHLYVRSKVLRTYFKLSKKGVELKPQTLLSRKGLHMARVKYPEYEAELELFAKHLKASIGITSAVIIGTLIIVLVRFV